MTPTISARLHKQSTFRKPAKSDRRETEMFREFTNLRCSVFIVAGEEHDSPANGDRPIAIQQAWLQDVTAGKKVLAIDNWAPTQKANWNLPTIIHVG